jgi:hypothetical protein
VDVGHHTLEYQIPFSDPSGRAGFVATVAVDAFVRDPTEAAQQGAASVKDSLEPALRRAVVEAGGRAEPVSEQDAIAALTTMRQHADATVRETVHEDLRGLPPWLSAQVLSVTVAFDDATQRHHTELLGRTWHGQVIDATTENEKKEATGALAVRALWRDELLPHLSDPSRRVFEVAFANPTDENIAKAVGHANNAELAMTSKVVELLDKMLEQDLVDKDDPVHKIIAALGGRVQQLYLAGGAPALPDPGANDALGSSGDGADELPEEQKGDRDFTDR